MMSCPFSLFNYYSNISLAHHFIDEFIKKDSQNHFKGSTLLDKCLLHSENFWNFMFECALDERSTILSNKITLFFISKYTIISKYPYQFFINMTIN